MSTIKNPILHCIPTNDPFSFIDNNSLPHGNSSLDEPIVIQSNQVDVGSELTNSQRLKCFVLKNENITFASEDSQSYLQKIQLFVEYTGDGFDTGSHIGSDNIMAHNDIDNNASEFHDDAVGNTSEPKLADQLSLTLDMMLFTLYEEPSFEGENLYFHLFRLLEKLPFLIWDKVY
ncbi:hypothetical protein Nepgr_017789 [Nepenthes gracilis]|uniref:Uncharacterized protein n=1 Tax=Nepenthes gracilis TaxID=150966 RepID=A0AAD3SQ19_NEPGR|nr:hypothetical protein Nepgr_017789 [Nepenthes gracilis]